MKVTDDQSARDAISTELDTNILVEAGAGSGKTTMLVSRMLGLIARGTPVDQIAAITFTRKAANELREKFQMKLEEAALGDDNAETRSRCAAALDDLDAGFLGTIHAFCARLLRERPLQAGLDPEFEEIAEEEWEIAQSDFWRRWVERTEMNGDPMIVALREVGVTPVILEDGFKKIVTYPDVTFEFSNTTAPDVSSCRKKLEALLAKGAKLLPENEPAGGWDALMRLIRRLNHKRRTQDWDDIGAFCAVVEQIKKAHLKPTQYHWGEQKESKDAAKALGLEFEALLQVEIESVLRCWREHRYQPVIKYLLAASASFERERISHGRLGYSDLLLRSAKLLRENPGVRDELGARYRYLLVDEFQDTDPVQAEVCFLLTSDSTEGNTWTKVTPRPGSLFVVGDPKQSIYRFRRADIQVYDTVKDRISRFGKILVLTRNFRSVKAIETFINSHFSSEKAPGVFILPPERSATQAAFSPMQSVNDGAKGDGVFTYFVEPEEFKKETIVDVDAEMVASMIVKQIDAKKARPEDFLILTPATYGIAEYAEALSARNIPVSTAGAPLPQERELSELLVLLHCLADPDNAVLVAAALEGLFFGCSPADLFEGHQAGLRFSVSHPPDASALRMGKALEKMHEWWAFSQAHPADVLMERIFADTGLLFLAASQDLGDAGAGALLHLVEALRVRSTQGASALTDAMAELEVILGADAADAPLRPGRTDAVRVMNLHKAKGLEAEVVILAAPTNKKEWAPEFHIERCEDGSAKGWIVIDVEGENSTTIVAQPPGWDEKAKRESAFQAAERDRLLYVATTRAKRKLFVARCIQEIKAGPKPECAMWSGLLPTLDKLATKVELEIVEAEGRREAEAKPSDVKKRIAEAEKKRVDASVRSFIRVAVTSEAKRMKAIPDDGDRDPQPKRGLGKAWGRAVHSVIEGMGRGRRGETLTRFIKAVAMVEELNDAEAARLERVPALVESTESWKKLMASGSAQWELTVMLRQDGGEHAKLLEGVIDAAVQTPDGWTVVDWKTDDVEEDEWAARAAGYKNQIEAYSHSINALSGSKVSAQLERIKLT